MTTEMPPALWRATMPLCVKCIEVTSNGSRERVVARMTCGPQLRQYTTCDGKGDRPTPESCLPLLLGMMGDHSSCSHAMSEGSAAPEAKARGRPLKVDDDQVRKW